MQVETFREFIMLARYQNFSAAAKQLFISQPALSNHIAALEKELGVTLVEREPSVGLTPAGRAFFEDICDCVGRVDAAVERCRQIANSTEKGVLVVKSPLGTSEIEQHFMRLLSGFRAAHPAIDVRFVPGDTEPLLDDLACGKIDCGMFYNRPAVDESVREDVEFIHFHTSPLIACMPESHPLACEESLTMKDLEGYPYPIPSGVRYQEFQQMIEEMYAAHGAKPHFAYRITSSFEDYAFSLGGEDVILGAAGSFAIAGWTGKLFDPPIMQESYIGLARGQNPAVQMFREYVVQSLAD